MKLSELFADLDPRIADTLERSVRGLRDEIVDRVDALRGELLGRAPATEPSGSGRREAYDGGGGSLGALLEATVDVDRAGSQAEILTALLEGGARFGSRTAFFLLTGEKPRCWGSVGFEDAGRALEGEPFDPPADSGWARLAEAGGALPLDARECALLTRAFDAPQAEAGLLIPLLLGEEVAGCLYCDRLGADELEPVPLRLLTFVAGQALEALPVRGRASTATLRLAEPVDEEAAGTEIEAPPVEAVADEPTGEPVEAEPIEPPPPPDAARPPEVEPAAEPVEAEPPPSGLEPTESEPAQLETPPDAPVTTEAEPAAERAPESEDLSTGAAAAAEGPTAEGPTAEQIPVAEPPAPGELPEPADDEPLGAAAETSPAAEERTPHSTQVEPPEDVRGPGFAFTTQEIPRDSGEEALHEEARRLARLLVTEIKLYNEEQVEQGRRNADIYRRLQEDIDRSRQIFQDRMDQRVAGDRDHFREALVRILAGGDETLLGD